MDNGLIPRIWAERIERSLSERSIFLERLQRREQWRMENDQAYQLQQAENEAWSYWEALYDNQIEYEEEEYW